MNRSLQLGAFAARSCCYQPRSGHPEGTGSVRASGRGHNGYARPTSILPRDAEVYRRTAP